MYLMIVFLPLISSILLIIFGYKIGYKGSPFISIFSLFINLLIIIVIFYIKNNNIIIINLGYWINFHNINIKFEFIFNTLSLSMIFLIINVSLIVNVFSINYMYKEPKKIKFFSFLNLFTFFMLILVTSNNLIQLFIGWEGVGICSFLLISFWTTRNEANISAFKALILNKIGDVCFIYSSCLLYLQYNSFNFPVIFSLSKIYFINNSNYYINILLFISICAKSSQIGLHTWLPDAMEGPTPVSALIHAATMVTAGVFLLIKMSPLYTLTPFICYHITYIGSLTAIFSAFIGLFQNDLKKVIAYSTCSQLGYMIMIIGQNFFEIGFFHLINHGFFKSLLFLSAGSILHSLNNQNHNKSGNLLKIIPITYITLLIGSFSLMGLPFLTGFFSKDIILELLWNSNIYNEEYICKKNSLIIIAYFSALLSSLYSIKLIILTFIVNYKGYFNNIIYLKENDFISIISLMYLCFWSVFGGYIFNNFIILPIKPIIQIIYLFKLIPIIIILFSFYFIYNYYINNIYILNLNNFYLLKLFKFIIKGFYIDELYNKYIINNINYIFFTYIYRFNDNKILEKFGPNNSKNIIEIISSIFYKYHYNLHIIHILMFLLFFIIYFK